MNLKQMESHCAEARALGAKDDMVILHDDAALSPKVSIDLGEVEEQADVEPSIVRVASMKLGHAV